MTYLIIFLVFSFFLLILYFTYLFIDIEKEKNEEILKVNKILKETEEKLKDSNEIVKLFDEPKPRISYDEWYRNKYQDVPTNTRLWNEYWSEICMDEYCAWYIRKISIYPKFLINLINEIKNFDFDKVSEHMKSVNWTWCDKKETPTIKEMIDCVFSLAHSLKTQNDKDGCYSGGFEVKRMTDDRAEITFKYNSYIPDYF